MSFPSEVISACKALLPEVCIQRANTSVSYFGIVAEDGRRIAYPSYQPCSALWLDNSRHYLFYSVSQGYRIEKYKPFYDWLFNKSPFRDCFDTTFLEEKGHMVIVKPLPQAYIATIIMRVWESEQRTDLMLELNSLGYPMLLARYITCIVDKVSKGYRIHHPTSQGHYAPNVNNIVSREGMLAALTDRNDLFGKRTDSNGFLRNSYIFKGANVHGEASSQSSAMGFFLKVMAERIKIKEEQEVNCSFCKPLMVHLNASKREYLTLTKDEMLVLLDKIKEFANESLD